MWTCLEVVLYHNSNLSCQDINSLDRNTEQESALAAPASHHESTEVACHHKFSLPSHNKQRKQGKPVQDCHQRRPVSVKSNEDQQRAARKTNARTSSVHSLLHYTSILPNIMCLLNHLLQQNITCPFTCSFQKHTPCVFSAKHPLT